MSDETLESPGAETQAEPQAEPPVARTGSAPQKGALDALLSDKAQWLPLQRKLFRVAAMHYVRGADAEDVVDECVRLAIQREREGNPWDPQARTAISLLGGILGGVISNVNRGARRKPTSALQPEHDAPSESATADEILLEAEDEALRERDADDLLAWLDEQSKTGLTVRVVRATREGISGHAKLARHLKCTVAEVHAAIERLLYRARKRRPKAARGRA